MKTILFKRICNPNKRTKSLTMSHQTEDEQTVTYVQKNFIYMVYKIDNTDTPINQPQIYIKKLTDHKQGLEQINFKVKGFFYLRQERMLLKVRFQHNLFIRIDHKDKIFSPKKSAVLT